MLAIVYSILIVNMMKKTESEMRRQFLHSFAPILVTAAVAFPVLADPFSQSLLIANGSRISRLDPDGSANTILETGDVFDIGRVHFAEGLDRIFFDRNSPGGSALWSIAANGSDLQEEFGPNGNFFHTIGISSDGTTAYLRNGTIIERVDTLTGQRTTVVSGLNVFSGEAVDFARNTLYWSAPDGELVRADLDGTSVNTVPTNGGVMGISVVPSSGRLYFRGVPENPIEPFDVRIIGMNPDGTNLTTSMKLWDGWSIEFMLFDDGSDQLVFAGDSVLSGLQRTNANGDFPEFFNPGGLNFGINGLAFIPEPTWSLTIVLLISALVGFRRFE